MKETGRYLDMVVPVMVVLSACAGMNTFTAAARPGETGASGINAAVTQH